MKDRQRRLSEALASSEADAMLVTEIHNVRYLTGFTGSAGVMAMSRGRAAFFTDGRYTQQARSEVRGAKLHVKKKATLTAALEWLHEGRAKVIAIEADHLTLEQSGQIKKILRSLKSHARLKAMSGLVMGLRTIKDGDEIRRIRRAARLASGCMDAALRAMHLGTSESEVAAELEYACRRAGAEGMSFETIVAGGKRSALPHGVASEAKLPKRGFVVLDYGVILAGYCSDMTRTVYLGQPSKKERAIYDAVLASHEAAKAAVRPGVTCEQVDAAARDVLKRAKLEQYFTHSTGHGVGLEIHEPPRIGKKQRDELQAGMVITIEPGVYLPDFGGVRIEDMVLVTKSGCETLTPTAKSLITL